MMKQQISSTQLCFLLASSALMFPYTFMPIFRVPPMNQDVLIVLLLSVFYIVFLNSPLLILTNKFRGCKFTQMNDILLGKIGGKFCSSLFMFFAFLCYFECLMITIQFTNIYFLSATPVWFLALIMIIPVFYASMKGAGTIGRIALIILPLIIITIVFFFALGIKDFELNLMRPVLKDSSFIELNKGAIITAARFSEILLLSVFSFYLNKNISITKTYFKGLLIFVLCYALIISSTLLMLGSNFAKILNNPYLIYSRQVGGAEFIERVQSLNKLAWIIGVLLKLTAYSFISSEILFGITKKKTQKFYVLPISLLVFLLSIIPYLKLMSTTHFINNDNFFPFIVIGIIFVLPLILLFIYFIRKKKQLQKINLQTIENDKER